MPKLLVANWKENPVKESTAAKLFGDIAKAKRTGVEVVICPPFIYLEEVAVSYRKMAPAAKKNLGLGAQDVFWEESGAFTSEVGPKMLRSLGAKFVIIGHSERRRLMKETDAMINKKMQLALRDRLQPILCVGEPATIRRKGMALAKAYVRNQLEKDLVGIDPAPRLTIAYEPIWAIGTGKNDTPKDAADMADFIKTFLKHRENEDGGRNAGGVVRVLYGGSVNAQNIADYVQWKEIDGALVGGASLKVDEFTTMIGLVGGQKRT